MDGNCVKFCDFVYRRYVREKNEFELDKTLTPENKCISSDVDDLINHQKITDESNERMDLEKGDHLDSEEETG